MSRRPPTRAEWVYDWLLGLYPPAFRREYGAALRQAFRDGLRDAAAEGTQGALLRLWGRTLADLATSAVRERTTTVSRMTLLVLVLALSLGAAIGWVDSRPTWDDTGITVGVLLLAGGALGLLQPRRPWRWALALGLWVPILNLLTTGNAAALVAVVPAALGAYAGAGLRRLAAAT